MQSYRETFPRRHTLLIVIHVEEREQTLRNVRVALGEGADGVFLINHHVYVEDLYSCYQAVREAFPSDWIGINWLNILKTEELKMMRPGMSGLWTDYAGVNGDGKCGRAAMFAELRTSWETQWKSSFLFFGGVAFKYQGLVKDVALVARLSVPFVDVVTTSGEGTGIAADIWKIKTMKDAIGDHPLAIASGITPENVIEYMPYADCFLVATGVSDSHTELNPAKVRKLAQKISS